jgi:pimeloyl-ACP methyl ester carboxylesterase
VTIAEIPIQLGREMAATIPGARFVALPGSNHIMLEKESGVAPLFAELRDFLNEKAWRSVRFRG